MSRLAIVRRTGWDDYLIVFGWVRIISAVHISPFYHGSGLIVREYTVGLIILQQAIAGGLSFSAAFGTSKGLGLHDADILDQWVFPVRKCEYAFSVLYVISPGLSTTSTADHSRIPP